MYVMTPQGTYRMDLLCGTIVEPSDPIYDSDPTPEAIASCVQRSTFKTKLELPEADAKLVTLSTCTYEFDNARYVVVGVLTLVEEAANS